MTATEFKKAITRLEDKSTYYAKITYISRGQQKQNSIFVLHLDNDIIAAFDTYISCLYVFNEATQKYRQRINKLIERLNPLTICRCYRLISGNLITNRYPFKNYIHFTPEEQLYLLEKDYEQFFGDYIS